MPEGLPVSVLLHKSTITQVFTYTFFPLMIIFNSMFKASKENFAHLDVLEGRDITVYGRDH